MSKQIIQKEEARTKIKAGVEAIVSPVASSLGPRGTQVGIDYGYEVTSVRDGVTIAQSIQLEDAGENWAVRVIQQAANKQVATVGDGTSVVCILAQAIYEQAIQNIIAGVHPMELVSGLEEGRDILLAELAKHATPIKKIDQAVQVARISSQDEELGSLIGETIFNLGLDGVVTTDQSPTGKTYLDHQEGMQFDQGYISPAFITDPTRMEATIENTYVLLTDREIANVQEIAPLLDQFATNKVANLVVIAPDVTNSMLGSMIVTKLKGAMNLLAVRAPYAGNTQKDFLDDIALLTGGKVISSQAGQRFENVDITDLGKATRVTATEKSTLIIGPSEQKKHVTARVTQLKTLINRNEGSDYEREKLKERYAKLTNGIAVIKVGAPTEIEMKNWIERAKDAIEATTAALKEGIIPGGEIIYLTLRKALSQTTLSQKILAKALEKPFITLLTNAGLEPYQYIEKVTDKLGIDVTDHHVKDMITAGIIDPALVTSQSLTNAISVAIMLATTERLILPLPEKK